MKFKGLTALAAAMAVTAAAGFAGDVAARTLKVQTSSNASHFSLAYLNEVWIPKLKQMTGGEVEIEFLPIEAVVPRRETPEAVGIGILDGQYTAVAYFSGTDPGFALMGDLIAGYDRADQIQYLCSAGGGKEMLQKLYDAYFEGLHVVGCTAYSREAFVSKVPINGVADLAGLKIRSPEGLASDVFKRAGAAPVALPTSETYGALEKGVIDAADNSSYTNNDANGMHKVAKFPIFPGIHSMPILDFTLNADVWEEIGPENQAILEVWWEAAMNGLRMRTEVVDQQLVARDKAGGDITVIDWPLDERAKLREIAVEAWQDFAASSELGQEAFDTHMNFMRESGLLKEE
ncbi:MAG: TRAP transporter substrate-binding protein DctP [Geminicoccaceae bacterium]